MRAADRGIVTLLWPTVPGDSVLITQGCTIGHFRAPSGFSEEKGNMLIR